jgi:hypothetical protein
VRNITVPVIALIMALIISACSSCQIFLGPDPDSSPQGIFESLWTDFDESYALFDTKGIDWNGVKNDFSPAISSGMGDRELFRVCSNMLLTLKDAHVSLTSDNYGTISFYYEDETNLFDLEIVKTYLDNNTISDSGYSYFLYGRFASRPEVGYIYIPNFEGADSIGQTNNWIKAIDGIIRSFGDAAAIVVDIRNNPGGAPKNVDYIVGRFAATQENYLQICTKNGPGRNDFSDPISRAIKPAGSRYTKPVVLLTNRKTVSAAEWFTLALRTQDQVTHAGETTRGAFSLRLLRPLINGWTYSMSIQKNTDMDGKSYEGEGICPEITVLNTTEELADGRDRQIEYARDFVP